MVQHFRYTPCSASGFSPTSPNSAPHGIVSSQEEEEEDGRSGIDDDNDDDDGKRGGGRERLRRQSRETK